METITLRPITDENREAVLALTVRDDQPFVAPNDASLEEAEKANAENPGYARPFGIYADDKLVGFCMFSFDPEDEDEEDRYLPIPATSSRSTVTTCMCSTLSISMPRTGITHSGI